MAPQLTETLLPENDPGKEDPSITFGKFLANPLPGEEVAITGLSGQYPESDNVYQFRDNLFNKTDMITDDSRRWEPGHPEIPQRIGKIPNLECFDAGFFGIHHRQSNNMDPMIRSFLERATEAIFDAGFHLSELEGTNTGVFVGASFSESEKHCFFDKLVPHNYPITGCTRSLIANRLSYFLKLKGPSFISDTACSSSLYALEHAYKAIRSGQCDMAIVGGTNLTLHPFVSLQFSRLGVLSMDGVCKVFDNAGNGYVRSEAVSAIFLQKAKDSRRIYSTIVHAKSNCDGYKNSGITYPSGEMQVQLLKEFYEECDTVKPTDLSFLEAHGTGTKVGDPEELLAIEEVFVKYRKSALLLGSVKSNIGHTEPSSGLCSVTKVIIAFESGYIPPNINYKTPKAGIKSLENGCLKVVTEKMPFTDNRGLVGIDSFGFGGANCHVLLKHNPKTKVNNGRPKDNIPRLVCISGRTKEAVETLLNDVNANQCDMEHIGLLHQIFRRSIDNHHYRGYSLISKSGEISRSIGCKSIKKPILIVCFGIIDKTIRQNAREFLQVPVFVGYIQRIHEVLQTKGFDITSTLLKSEPLSTLEIFLSNLTLQLVFADVFKSLDMVPNRIFGVTRGSSLGTLVCAYYDGALTIGEVIECAYAVAQAISSVSTNCVADSDKMDALISKSDKVATQLQKNLTRILVKPRRLSKTVIFESSPPEISSIYLTNSYGNMKVLKDVRNVVSKNDVIFEIGDGSICKELENAANHTHYNMFNNNIQNLGQFLNSLGRLFELGFQPQIQNLYPKVKFPVGRGTPMISPKIKWDHSKSWYVTRYNSTENMEIEEKTGGIVVIDPTWTYVEGHNIDGRILFPATGYLVLVWETLAHIHNRMISDMKVLFEEVRFRRACVVPLEHRKLDLTVMVQRGTGNFEVIEGGSPVVTGRITQPADSEIDLIPIDLPTGVPEHTAPHLKTKDIYKELRLRGYNYKGVFKGLQSCDNSTQVGKISWDGSWIPFMDTMLQMKILQEDTRLLYVPTSIKRLTIDGKKHIEYAQSFGEQPELPVYAPIDSGIIRSGAIEIRGLTASSIARRKYRGIPVLEKYVFVPNVGYSKTDQAVRVNVQILLENIRSIKVKVVEVIDEATTKELTPLGDLIFDALADQPLIQPDITILGKDDLETKNVKVEDKKLLMEVDCSLVVGSKLLQRQPLLQVALGCIKPNAFILSREPQDFDETTCSHQGITIVTVFVTGEEKLVFFRKSSEYKLPTIVKISSNDDSYTWLPTLKAALQKNEPLLVHTQNDPLNGALGMVNCLRLEPGGQNVSLLFTADSAPAFESDLPLYKDQMKKNLAVNIYKEGKWGTYRHLLLEESNTIQVEHCFLNSTIRGDLSSLSWLEGPLSCDSTIDPEEVLVSVYYAALNFRDVMTASGKINVDSITGDRRLQECVQGFEYAGRSQDGKRIMGLLTSGACASLITADPYLMWEIPDHWSLKEACTVPVVYVTCLYALMERGKVKRGDTVLIHSGTGGIGQAGITLALYLGCTVYTTVGTKEKREFLKNKFPQLTDKHIASSRDTTFEKQIMTATKGRGVDIVINSLAEEKLIASLRCLAHGGRFVEIGKFDLASDNFLNLLLLEKGASFHGLMLDAVFYQPAHVKTEMHAIFLEGIKNGAIKPLPTTVFKMEQVEDAFRYMSTGKHMGKVLIEIRLEEQEKCVQPSKMMFTCCPRYYCDRNKTYIICGGLGGFGLELADWLALRGCKKMVLVSRNGLKTGYQAYRIGIWKSYGCTIHISTQDITTREGCKNLIEEGNKLGPVDAIFNLAVVLRDAIFENQTEETYKVSFGPKAYATQYLDEITRTLCPQLRNFVVFSSVSCGRGNAGQTNYGMANSVMEKICEKRRKEGLPAVAIEWGAVGEVGLIANLKEDAIELEIGGTLQQRISSCLQVLDQLMRQNESAVVSSMVVAEKRAGSGGTDNIVDTVANILGVKDIKTISLQSTLAEVGMDSMTAVEIKQTLEREFEVFLTPQDIKTMTFARLIEIQTERDSCIKSDSKKERPLFGMEMIIRRIGDPTTSEIPVITRSNQLSDKQILPTCVLFSGIDGIASVLESLYKNLDANLLLVQFPNFTQKDSIEEMAEDCVMILEEKLPKTQPFTIIGYSFGGIVALESVRKLEQRGFIGTLICIDSAPDYLNTLAKTIDIDVEDKFQVNVIVQLMSLQISYEVIVQHLESLLKCATFDDRIKLALDVIGKASPYTPEYSRAFAIGIYKRLKAMVNWNPDFKIKSNLMLFKPNLVSLALADEDYGLSKLCHNAVKVHEFEGNHVTILDNPKVGEEINKMLQGLPVDQEKDASKKSFISVDKIQAEIVG